MTTAHVVETGVVISKLDLLRKAMAYFHARLPGAVVQVTEDRSGYSFRWQAPADTAERASLEGRIARLAHEYRKAAV